MRNPAASLIATVWIAGGCGRLGFGGDDATDASPAADAFVDLACDPRTPSQVVALFTFDGEDPYADATGAHDGAPRGGTSSTAGPCGAALVFAAAGDYALVPDSDAFDLADGAVDLYARVDALGARRGLLSRDAGGTSVAGHLSLGVTVDGIVWLRMQQQGTDNVDHFRCADAPITAGAWFHVGVSFGAAGMALWIDHVPQTARAGLNVYEDPGGAMVDCQFPYTGGIAGPADPWVLGGVAWTATEGEAEPFVELPLGPGAIDHVRIRDTWVDFAR